MCEAPAAARSSVQQCWFCQAFFVAVLLRLIPLRGTQPRSEKLFWLASYVADTYRSRKISRSF